MSRKYPWRDNVKRKCGRCHEALSYIEDEAPIEFKGGFRGYFCAACVVVFNEAYHNSPATLLLREYGLKIEVLQLLLSKPSLDPEKTLPLLLPLVSEAARLENEAMKTLFFLAKETMAPLPEKPLNVIPALTCAEPHGSDQATQPVED